MVVIYGEAYGHKYVFEGKVVSRTDQELVIVTNSEPPQKIKLEPLYFDTVIGSKDIVIAAGPATICAFYFNDQRVALAFLVEYEDSTEVIVHEYGKYKEYRKPKGEK